MAIAVTSRITRGTNNTSPFAVAWEDDLKLSHVTVDTLVDRDAIPEWKRKAQMTCFVIETATEYRLGNDITILGQVWTERDFGVPSNVVTEDEVFDSEGFIKPELLRNIFLNDSYVVDDEAAMLALSTVTGNFVIRLDGGVFVKLNNDDPADITDFAELTYPGAITSVNGQTGPTVTITLAQLITANPTHFSDAIDANATILDIEAAIAALQADVGGIDLTNKADLVAGVVPLAQLPYSFTSGIDAAGANIKWNGDLTENTVLNAANTFSVTMQNLVQFNIEASSSISLLYDDGVNDFMLFADGLAGFRYDQDLSGGFSAHSLITKLYGDSHILGSALVDPAEDAIVFWDDSASAIKYLTLGANLNIIGTEISAVGGGGGVTNFLGLSDTPDSYSAQAGRGVRVTTLEDGLEFFTIATQYTDEMAQDAIGAILLNSAQINFFYNDTTPSITATIIDDSVTFSKVQNITSNRILGRITAAVGDIEELSVTDGVRLNAGALKLGGTVTDDVTVTTTTPNIIFRTIDTGIVSLQYGSFENLVTVNTLSAELRSFLVNNSYVRTVYGGGRAGVNISVTDDTNLLFLEFEITQDGVVYTDELNSKPIEYAANYAGAANNRSIMDKQYIDTKIASDGDTTLLDDIAILGDTGTYGLFLGEVADQLLSFEVNSSTGIIINTYNNTEIVLSSVDSNTSFTISDGGLFGSIGLPGDSTNFTFNLPTTSPAIMACTISTETILAGTIPTMLVQRYAEDGGGYLNESVGFGQELIIRNWHLNAGLSLSGVDLVLGTTLTSVTDGALSNKFYIKGVNNSTPVDFLEIDGELDNRIQLSGPLKLASYATGSLPTAANHEGSIVYDTTTNTVKFSDGATWANI